MNSHHKPMGRPKATPTEIGLRKNMLLQKIEPYLKSGLSVRSALSEARIANSEFYRYMEADSSFREQINRFKQFISVMTNNALIRELMTIIEKQNGNKIKGIRPQPLSVDDRKFLWVFALNNNLMKDMYGGRAKDVVAPDVEAEIQKVKRLLEGNTTKEILPA